MQIDILLLLKFLFWGSLALILPFILVKIYQILNNVNEIVLNAKTISEAASEGMETNDDFSNLASDIASKSANKVIESNVKKASNSVGELFANLLSKRR